MLPYRLSTRALGQWLTVGALVATLGGCIPLRAQPTPGLFTQLDGGGYPAEHWEVKDILRDRDGFLWIATTQGLYRYDGLGVTAYLDNPLDTNSIGDNYVTALAAGPDGTLWVGTGSLGLLRYDPYRDEFVRYTSAADLAARPAQGSVLDLLLDHGGNLWVATAGGLIWLAAGTDTLRPYGTSSAAVSASLTTPVGQLAEDDQGRIWLATGGEGLKYLDPATGELHLIPAGLGSYADRRVRSITNDGRGRLWFSTFRDGRLFELDPVTLQVTPYALFPREATGYRAKDIVADGTGGLWLATARGLIHYRPRTGSSVHYRHDPAERTSLPGDRVETLYLDPTGILWLGHKANGVSQLLTQSGGFEILSLQAVGDTTSAPPHILATRPDRHGTLWIGTWNNGLYRHDPQTGQTDHYRHRPGDAQSLASDMVWDSYEDRRGHLWIATHGGLQQFDPTRNRWRTYGQAQGLEHEAVRCLTEDRTGRLWVGTFGGLHWLDTTMDKLHLVDRFSGNVAFMVNDIFEDRRQYLWVATQNRGVFRRDPLTGNWENFQKHPGRPHGLSANSVRCFYADDRGRIWMGTEGGGLVRWDPTGGDADGWRHWRPYNSSLTAENVYHISADHRGRLWLSTDQGLFSFAPDTETFHSFRLPGRNPELESRTRSGSGSVQYAGSSERLYRFYPDRLRGNERSPRVFLTELAIRDRPVPIRGTRADSLPRVATPLTRSIRYTDSLELAYWQNDLTFTLAALNFVEPAYNRFRHRLRGYRDDWTETDAANRRIRYTNLAPGRYTLQVHAANNDGIWSEQPRELYLYIRPPWWWSPPSKLIYLALVLGGLWALRRYELGRQATRAEATRLQELDEVKTRLYQNITHEFRTPLTIVLGTIDQLEGQVRPVGRPGLQTIRRNSRQLLRLVTQMLDLAKLESGQLQYRPEQRDIVGFLKYLLESFQSYAESQQIRLRFRTAFAELSMDFDPERLQHVISNLLSNAIKFTPAGGTVRLVLWTDTGGPVPDSPARLRISVEDNGIGIPADQLPHLFGRFYQADNSSTRRHEGTGIGLTLAWELVQLMGGRLTVVSEENAGSTFTVILPITYHAPVVTEPRTALSTPLVPDQTAPFVSAPVEDAKDERPLLLIVEDNIDLVRYLADLLSPTYRLIIAYDGHEGCRTATTRIPDLIISDVMMPQKDGFALCHELKEHPLTSHVPVILLTARADTGSRMQGLRRGADAYLAKPFLPEELMTRIGALLAQRRRLQTYYLAQAGLTDPAGEAVPPATEEAKLENAFLARVNELIQAALPEGGITVEQLSDAMYMDASNLYRKLKALTGLTPSQYVRSLQIAAAKRLLQQSERSIAAIAYDCGFSEQSYFARIFKKETGQSPSQFRKRRNAGRDRGVRI